MAAVAGRLWLGEGRPCSRRAGGLVQGCRGPDAHAVPTRSPLARPCNPRAAATCPSTPPASPSSPWSSPASSNPTPAELPAESHAQPHQPALAGSGSRAPAHARPPQLTVRRPNHPDPQPRMAATNTRFNKPRPVGRRALPPPGGRSRTVPLHRSLPSTHSHTESLSPIVHPPLFAHHAPNPHPHPALPLGGCLPPPQPLTPCMPQTHTPMPPHP